MPTIDETIVHNLAANGIERIWGVPGDSLNAVTEAIRREKGIEWMLARHEEEATFVAGEVELTGDLTVSAGSCGPGNMQRALRRASQPGARARLSHPERRDRQSVLPGNPARLTVPRLHSLLRNGPQC